jgi:colicin import membrane protein
MTSHMAQFALRLAVVAVLGGCTSAALQPSVTPAVAPTTSVDEANRKLAEVAVNRAAIEATYADSEKVCYNKFAVNTCLDAAKEKRRVALSYQGAVEDEAHYFKRKAAVDERDREVAKAVKQFEEDEARAAAQPAPEPRAEAAPIPVAPKAALAARRASHEARLARHDAKEQADAPKRAAGVKAYEQRKLDAEKRQREVAAKLEAKAAKAADKASAPVAPAGK